VHVKKTAISVFALVAFAISMITVQASPASASSPSEIASLSVGLIPAQVAISPDGSTAFVTNTASGSVTVIDIASRAVTTTITVGTTPYGVAFKPDGSQAYVVNRDSDNVSVIDTSSNTVASVITVGDAPYGVTFSVDGNQAYVANSQDDTVSVISTANATVTTTISGFDEPIWLATNLVTSSVYVVNQGSDRVSEIQGTTRTRESDPITDAYSASVSPDGASLYVTSLSNPGFITVLNANTLVPSGGTIGVGGFFFFSSFSADGSLAFVPSNSTDTLRVIDPDSRAIDTVTGYPLALTGKSPVSVAVTPDCTTAIVVMANYPSGGGPTGFASIVDTGQPSCATPPPVPPEPNPEIAKTGTNSSQALLSVLGAGALLAVGATIMVIRRRRTSRLE